MRFHYDVREQNKTFLAQAGLLTHNSAYWEQLEGLLTIAGIQQPFNNQNWVGDMGEGLYQ